MNIGDTVRLRNADKVQRDGYSEWQQEYRPVKGVVEYISPHGWVVVRLWRSGTRCGIYCECFDASQLVAVQK